MKSVQIPFRIVERIYPKKSDFTKHIGAYKIMVNIAIRILKREGEKVSDEISGMIKLRRAVSSLYTDLLSAD